MRSYNPRPGDTHCVVYGTPDGELLVSYWPSASAAHNEMRSLLEIGARSARVESLAELDILEYGYAPGSPAALIVSDAYQNGWLVNICGDTMKLTRRESIVTVTVSVRDTLTYAAINMQGSAGRIPAHPQRRLAQARGWLSAPGEAT